MNQYDLFECPDCSRLHDEPATAMLGLAVPCLDCAIDEPDAARPATEWVRAA